MSWVGYQSALTMRCAKEGNSHQGQYFESHHGYWKPAIDAVVLALRQSVSKQVEKSLMGTSAE